MGTYLDFFNTTTNGKILVMIDGTFPMMYKNAVVVGVCSGSGL